MENGDFCVGKLPLRFSQGGGEGIADAVSIQRSGVGGEA